MKKINNIEKYVFSVLFLVGLFVLAGLSMKNSLPVLQETVQKLADHIQELNTTGYQKTYTAVAGEDSSSEGGIEDAQNVMDAITACLLEIDSNISENVYRRYDWIETYGVLNRVIGKKEVNGFSYALDKNGAYNSVNFWNEVEDTNIRRFSQQLYLLKQDVEAHGGKMLFMGYPNKYYEKWNSGYKGIPYNGYNSKMDELLVWNRRYGIDSIDYRELLVDSGLTFEEMFYKTDHHWTGYAAFLAFEELVNHLNEEYDAGLDEDGYYRNIDNYEVEWHEDMFLGSSGRNVGISFAGGELEDFQTVVPKFSGNFTWNGKTGDYTDSVIVDEKLEYEDIYQSDPYAYYLDGVSSRDTIINHDNPDGLKMFFIRDSFASPIIIDMLPFCSQIDCVWGKYATDEYVKEMIAEGDYDYVFVGYYTEDILPNFFHFYKNDYMKEQEE